MSSPFNFTDWPIEELEKLLPDYKSKYEASLAIHGKSYLESQMLRAWVVAMEFELRSRKAKNESARPKGT